MIVLDASVLVELVSEGEHRDAADELLNRYEREPGLVLVSAAHALTEAASALRRLVRKGDLSTEAGHVAVGWLSALDVVLDPPGPRLPRIWELRDRMSTYDAAYAAAAEALGLPLLSADRRLVDACRQARISARLLAPNVLD